ncbi:MAG: hypothetical protein MOGMAGMI_02498 [Candidatus Omnitrophica bacterium]|nr:hypothetical protein [Candidatus Omnitrophota bacterium]
MRTLIMRNAEYKITLCQLIADDTEALRQFQREIRTLKARDDTALEKLRKLCSYSIYHKHLGRIGDIYLLEGDAKNGGVHPFEWSKVVKTTSG